MLKTQMKVKKSIEQVLGEIRQSEVDARSFTLLDQRIRRILQDYCPEAQGTQLFLARDEKASRLYTYLVGESKSTFASLIKATHDNPGFEQQES